MERAVVEANAAFIAEEKLIKSYFLKSNEEGHGGGRKCCCMDTKIVDDLNEEKFL